MADIDFKGLAKAALARAESLLGQWLPDGHKSGYEWKSRNPVRDDHSEGSFSINCSTGAWADFACDDKGGDLVSLYAYLFCSGDQLAAAKDLAAVLGMPEAIPPLEKGTARGRVPTPAPEPTVKEKKPGWQPVLPVPDDAPAPPAAHEFRGIPAALWTYRDQAGRVLGYVGRFVTSDGGKEVLPLSFCRHDVTGKLAWRWLSFPAPRPLYGLDKLAASPDATVLIVEGEKCADAAQAQLPALVTMSWPGGGNAVDKADWSPLAGRKVMTWADCDMKRVKLSKADKDVGMDAADQPLLPEDKQPGVKAMAIARGILHGLGCKLWNVEIPAPGDKPDGWDVADAIAEGMTGEQLSNYIRAQYVPWAPVEESIPTPSDDGADAPEPGGRGKNKRPIDWDKANRLLAEYVLIYGTDTVYDLKCRMVLKVNALRLAYGSDYVKLWLNHDHRRMILPDQLVFEPSGHVVEPCINLFSGFDCKPKKGDYQPIIELLTHLCADSAETAAGAEQVMLWCLKWIALPLQKPGTKMRSALVFHGPQGAGKNLFFEVVAAIYGRYALVVGQEQLEDKFNDWASQKCFLIGDEVVARAELYHQKNKLKAFITGETIQINTKMLPLRTERNYVNVVFLSNEHQPLALEEGDRRYFCVYTPPRRHDDLYWRVAECLRNGGREAFLDYLLKLDLSGFTEFDIPPMTTAKRDLIELGLKPAERFVREWVSGLLPLPLMVCGAGQLYRAFKRWCSVTGERFPPPQEAFTKSVKKTVELLAHTVSRAKGMPVDLLHYKVTKLDDVVNGKRNERIWLPDGCAPPDGQTEGKWAASSVADFEEYLGKFMTETGGSAP